MTALERHGAAAPTVRFVQTGAGRWCGTGSAAESVDARRVSSQVQQLTQEVA